MGNDEDSQEMVDLLPDMVMSDTPSTSSASSSLCQINRPPNKDDSNFNDRLDYLKRKLQECAEHSERHKQFKEMLVAEQGPSQNKDILDESVRLDPTQEMLLEKMVNKTDPFIDAQPKLDSIFVLENSSPVVYDYPIECLSDQYKSRLRAHSNITDQKLIKYVMDFADVVNFGEFLSQIPSKELKVKVLDCFVLNLLSAKSDLHLNHATMVLEMIAESDGLVCSEWYLGVDLMLKVFLNLGLDVNKLHLLFPDKFTMLTGQGPEPGSQKTDKKKRKPIQKETFDQVTSIMVRVLNLSIKHKNGNYKKDREFELIFYLMCALMLDDKFDQGENLSLVIGRIVRQIFDDHSCELNLSDASATLANIFRPGDNSDANMLHHRAVYLIKKLSFNSPCQNIKQLSTKLALLCLQDVFKKFTNEPLNEKMDEKKIEVLIELLEKYCSDLFSNSSYTMYNVVLLLATIVNNHFLNLGDKSQVSTYLEMLKTIICDTIREVRDLMDFNGRIQVKIMLSHLAFTFGRSLTDSSDDSTSPLHFRHLKQRAEDQDDKENKAYSNRKRIADLISDPNCTLEDLNII